MATTAANVVHSAIDAVRVTACTIPTDLPESDGTIEWDKTTIVIVEVDSGSTTGIGYTYADVSTAKLIDTLLAHVVQGRDAMDVSGSGWRWRRQCVTSAGVGLRRWLFLPSISLFGILRPDCSNSLSSSFLVRYERPYLSMEVAALLLILWISFRSNSPIGLLPAFAWLR